MECILNYFIRIQKESTFIIITTSHLFSLYDISPSYSFPSINLSFFITLVPVGSLIVHRQVLTKDKVPDWKTSKKKFSDIEILVNGSHKIENTYVGNLPLHADFANQYIGGGVLHGVTNNHTIIIIIHILILDTKSDNRNNCLFLRVIGLVGWNTL